MIALFPSLESAQAYCDTRSSARGYPVTDKHPRTGRLRVITARWDVPRLHPSGDGRAWCAVDPEGARPSGCEFVEELPDDWKPKARADDGKV